MGRTVGHYAPWLLAALVGALIVAGLVPVVAAFVAWPAMAAALVVALLLGLAILAHNRRLCERCIASLPLDAAAVANRYALRFRTAHLFENRLLAVGYLVAVAAASFGYAHPVGRYGWAAAEASLVYLLFVYVTHQRLQPWCPHCENGGQEQSSPTTPTPVLTRA
ncbi:MAG TPA: hypothetical protein VNV66_14555 [Pilimelia sp.]|nr:hypothetical protein [Pilimelia sp.]